MKSTKFQLAILLLASILFVSGYATLYPVLAAESPETQFFGCTQYSSTLHCDPLTNSLDVRLLNATSTRIYDAQESDDAPPIFTAGVNGSALQFDGISSYVTIPHSPSLDITGDISISFWLKANSTEQAHQFFNIIGKVANEGPARQYLVYFSPGGGFLDFSSTMNNMDDDKWLDISAPADSPFDGSWHLWTITHDIANNTVRFYKDGELIDPSNYGRITTQVTSSNPDNRKSNSAPVVINNHALFRGSIDDARIYSRVLSSEEINAIFENVNDPLNGIAAQWTFDDTLKDVSGNLNDGKSLWNDYGMPITSMAFTPDGRLFFANKDSGKVRIIDNDLMTDAPFFEISNNPLDVVATERGLLGITIDPHFEQNHYIYLYHTYRDENTTDIFNRVVRLTDSNNIGTDLEVLIDRIPADCINHSGGALAFGDDDKLYVSIGDVCKPELSPDRSSLNGKILRINRDGTIPTDNPDPNSPIYTSGHRNVFGIAFTNRVGLVTENGQSNYDEINKLRKGADYGWPIKQPPKHPHETAIDSEKPLRSYWRPVAPTQMTFYDNEKFGTIQNKFLFGSFTMKEIYAIALDETGSKVISEDRIVTNSKEPVIALATSPDGSLYFAGFSIYKIEKIEPLSVRSPMSTIEITSTRQVGYLDVEDNRNFLAMYVEPGPVNSTFTMKLPADLLQGSLSIFDRNGTRLPAISSSFGNQLSMEFNLPSDSSEVIIVRTQQTDIDFTEQENLVSEGLVIVDLNDHIYGDPISGYSTIPIYTPLELQGKLFNPTDRPVFFAYVVMIENSHGVTTFIDARYSYIQAQNTSYESIYWMPEEADTYNIKVLLWNDVQNPVALAEPYLATIPVS